MPSRSKEVIWTLANIKNNQLKYGKLPAKLAEEIPLNKICVDLIGPCIIRRKVKKEKLCIEAVMEINPVTGCF